MNRTLFYNSVTVDGVDQIDFLHNALSNFKIYHRVRKYRIAEIDLMRPDLVSWKAYGTVRYWWLILLINKIDNPFTGFTIGQVLDIPNVLDIYEFYKCYKIR